MTGPARAAGGVAGTAALVLLGGLAVLRPAPMLARAPEAVGRLEGRVEVVTRPSRRLATPGAYPSRTVGVRSVAETSETANVIVYLNGDGVLPGGRPVTPQHATIRQSGEAFVPRVVAVTVGSTVAFPNDDLIFHNVFSLSGPATFDLGTYPKGESRDWTFDAPGLVKVYCHLHAHMTALVRVFDHPYFAVPTPDGRFDIAAVPAGEYEVVAWHERVGAVTRRVAIQPDETLNVAFSLPLREGR